jgi:hypothetical protein
MASLPNIRSRLPSLYRPEPGDRSLLTHLLRAVASRLDAVNGEMTEVMQAHWFVYADRGLYNPFFLRSRELLGLPAPDPFNAADCEALGQFPYIHDLARLASLLGLPPWREPAFLRENVETYWLRLKRTVALYRNGLGTVDGLRRMVEAQLPVDLQAPAGLEDRPFWVEEFAPLVAHTLAVQMPGEPVDKVGPLMRWTMQNDGLSAAPATLYIQGVTPQAGVVDPTTDPLIELYQSGSQPQRLGLAYRGTLAPDETLRLRPAFTSWLGMQTGVQLATVLPTANLPADPTAPGPWQPVAEAPTGTVVAMVQTADQTLWFAVNGTADAGELWRYNGGTWEQTLSGLAALHCLAEDGHDLLLGTQGGLLRLPLYPEAEVPPTASPVAALGTAPVYTIFATADGMRWFGTENGLVRRRTQPDGTHVYQPFVLHAEVGNQTAVYAINQDPGGTLYIGTALGLFQYQPGSGAWHWYAGDAPTEQIPEWQPLQPDATGAERNFPTAERVFLPPVYAVYRGQDASLWLGTERGMARYVARSVGGFAYETVLEAFPDVLTDRVYTIQEDARGLVWFCTGRGLLRYDGRDWWQFRSPAWVRLGRADVLQPEVLQPSRVGCFRNLSAAAPATPSRGAWRFSRTGGQWQRLEPAAGVWNSFTGEARSTAEPPVRALLWADSVTAELGTWDGTTFTGTGTVPPASLVMRFKPDETRIVDGGLPAVPRLPVGLSTWRYLALEPAELVEPADRPAWTVEGRLLPPPPERLAPPPGRYNGVIPPPVSNYDAAVFAFRPAARVWFQWQARRAFTVLVRLKKQRPDEQIDPAIVDRVWQGMQQVRPAGVRTMLAVEEETVRSTAGQ